MFKPPKVNLKWDSLYVYYLSSFNRLCGLVLSTDLRIEWVSRWQIWRRYLSMHPSIEGRETIAWYFKQQTEVHFYNIRWNNQVLFFVSITKEFSFCNFIFMWFWPCVDFRIYRNKPATLQVLDHVKIITTELTLVIIGIEMLLKGAVPSRKIRTMKWIKVKARHYKINRRKLKFTTKQIIITVRLIDLGKTQKLSITTRCFFFNILRHSFYPNEIY